MSSSVSRTAFRPGQACFMLASNHATSRVSHLAKRWISYHSDPTGAAPSQPPYVGSAEWEKFIAHVKRYQKPIVVTPSHSKQTYRLQRLENKRSDIERTVAELKESIKKESDANLKSKEKLNDGCIID